MPAVTTVSILLVRVLAQAVERAGAQRAQLLAAAEIDPSWLDDTQARLPLATYERAQLAALELSGDAALALHIGEQSSSAAFDVVGHLTAHAATLRQAIEATMRYSRILSQGAALILDEETETAVIRCASLVAGSSDQFSQELATSGLTRLIRAFVSPSARPRHVFFEYPAPAHRAEYRRIFDGAERFEHTFTGIEIERAWLDRTQLHNSPELYTVLKTQAERVLGRVTRDVDVAELVQEHLASCDPANMPTMEDIARHFGMSGRTLRRRLLAEHCAYEALVERTLADVAKRMIEDPQSSIQATAAAMGFATPAAFHRAFKRWTGTTPKAYKTSY
jgi:AraC-like DNA-binding protein